MTGIHWASTVPAFLALACLPFPFLFYKYGGSVRQKCKYAAEADAFMRSLRESVVTDPEVETTPSKEEEAEDEDKAETRSSSGVGEEEHRFERIKTAHSVSTQRDVPLYEESPFEIDRVHTKESFRSGRSKTESLAKKMNRK